MKQREVCIMKFCNNCGNDISSNLTGICDKCGLQLNVKQDNPKVKKPIIGIILMVLGVILYLITLMGV